MTVELFYDQTRPSAPWCVQYDGRQSHFFSRSLAEKLAREHGWVEPIAERLAAWLDAIKVDSPERVARLILERFDITDKDTSS